MSQPQDNRPTADEVTTGQAGHMLGISLQTVHNWIRSGKLEAREAWQGTKRLRFVKRASVERAQEDLRRLRDGA